MSQTPSTPAAAAPSARLPLDLAPLVYLAYVVFSLVWFRVYFSSEPIAAVDLPGHLTAVEGLRRNLLTLGYTYYDISCFTGYPAFQFYTFLVHWVTAIVSLPLTLVAEDPVRLAAHLMLVFGMVSLPLPWVWAVRPMCAELLDDDPVAMRRARAWVMSSACLYSFWFINHDSQWWGIGAAAVMNIGLFSQAFGWHFMLLHVGAVLRLLRNGRQHEVRLVAIFFTLLMLTHTMTAVFSFFIAFMSFLWFRERRMLLLKAHGVAALLMAFWIVPMAAYLSSYTIKDIHRPQGDFLEIVLRYPFFAIGRSLQSALSGRFELIGLAEPLIAILLTVLAIHRYSHKAKMLVAFMVFETIGLVILTSGFIASSVPLGFHYYRFTAYMMLFLVFLISVVPVYFLKSALTPGRPPWLLPAYTVFWGGVLLTAFITTVALPHNERDKVANTNNKTYLANEYKVLEYFRNLPDKGRVLFEYFSDYGKYPFLSCHFMETRLLKDTGFEAINGLFVQSSLAYHFPMGAANQLKANSYNGPLLYPASTDITDEEKVVQMKEFGVTHLVVGGDEFFNRVKAYALEEPVVIGPYKILRIQPAPSRVAPLKKHLAAYVDLRGNVSFKFMELYFYAKQALHPNYELIQVKPGDDIPPQVETIILNGSPSATASAGKQLQETVVRNGGAQPNVVTLDYVYYYLTKHYGTWYQHNPEIDDYAEFAKQLDKENFVRQFNLPAFQPEGLATPQFTWEPGNQRFSLAGMQAGKVYRVDYTYFPYWHTFDAGLYRMTGDRMLVWARGPTADAFYSRWLSVSTYVGWVMTLLGLWWVIRERRLHPAVA